MPSPRVICGGFAVAFAFAGSAPAAADDVRVQGIQVTQGVQLANNSIPLVADRTTAVRALVSTTGGGSTSTVTGRAHVTIDGVRVTPQFGLAPVTPLTAPVASPSLDSETDSLVFVLPAPTGIAPRDAKFATENVQVRVEITGSNDTNSTNNSAEVTGLRVESKAAPVIFFKRINWLGNPSVNPDSVIAPGAGDAYLRAALPLNDSDPGSLYRGGLQAHRFDLDLPPALFQPANGLLDAAAAGGPPEGDKLIVDLEIDRYILAGSQLLDPFTLFLWGWVGDGTTNNHDGLGAVGAAQAAYSVDDPRNGPCSLTHEALHNIGREHNASTIPISPATGFDATARLLNNPASNSVTGRLWPSTVTEILDGTTNNCTVGTWPGETNYRAFMDKLPDVPSRLFGNREPNPNTGIPLLPRRRCRTNLANLFGRVSGLSRTGRIARVADLSIWRARWCAAGVRLRGRFVQARATRAGAGAALHARLTVRSGGRDRVVRVPIDAEVSVSRGPRRRHTHGVGPFRTESSLAGAVRRVEVWQGARRLAAMRASPGRPTVALTGLRSGTTLSGTPRLRWSARDPDRGARLRFLVAYSPDRGGHWYPLGSNLTAQSLSVDARRLDSSRDGWFRVVATDGVNTDEHTVRGVIVRGG